MRLSDFDYDLPAAAIADFPPAIRGASRLLVLNRASGEIQHRHYADLIDYLNPGDVLILNDTKVIKARLIFKNADGHDQEIFLLEKHQPDQNSSPSENLVLHRGRVQVGEMLTLNSAQLTATADLGNGVIKVKSNVDLDQLADTAGQVPLPPYLHRPATPADEQRYQTVFAKYRGSVAAPTASLNITTELIDQLTAKGVHVHYLTLHVGLGTFLPIRTDDVAQHQMHSEFFIVPSQTVAAIQTARQTDHAVVALGTTVTRALEFAHQSILDQPPHDISGEANIFIYPGYQFKVVDHLITNFHAPKSTVLMLTAAFAGWDKLKPAYETALASGYRFLSYGDSMLII